jgi:hypothetical protein
MVTVVSGQTVEIYIPRDLKQDVEIWIGNFRKAREILEEVSAINRRLLKEKQLFPEE